jgi:RNA polymerase sigma-70 factor (ECF subfamily)
MLKAAAAGQESRLVREWDVNRAVASDWGDRLAVTRDDLVVPAQAPSKTSVDWEALYGRHSRDVNRYLLALTRDPEDAADLTAEAFERALRASARGAFPVDRALPWLLLVARRLAISRWRRARRLAVAVRRLPSRLGPSTEQERSEFLLWLDAITAVLSQRQREVLLLRYHVDLADNEIAEILGITESGVRSLVARAAASLRAHEELL